MECIYGSFELTWAFGWMQFSELREQIRTIYSNDDDTYDATNEMRLRTIS